MAYSDEKR